MNKKNIIFLYFVFIPFVLFSQNISNKYSLDDLIDIALKNSPEFEIIKLELQTAEHSYNEQTAFLYPQIDLDISVPLSFDKNEYENFNSVLGQYQTTSRTYNRINPSLSVISNHRIFTGGKISLDLSGYISRWNTDYHDKGNRLSGKAKIRYNQKLFSVNTYELDLQDAELQLNLARINFKSLKNDFIIKVINKYYELLVKIKSNEINLLAIKNTKFQHNLIVEHFKSGRKTELDTLQSSINLKNAELNIIRNQEDLHKIKTELNQLAGIQSNKIFEINLKMEFIPFAFSQSEIVGMCMVNHPNIIIDQIEIEKTRIALEELESRIGMSLDFSTSLSYQNNKDYQDHIITDQNYNLDVGLYFSMPLYDGGKSSSQIQKSDINTKKQNLSLLESHKALKQDIINLYQQFSIKQKEIRILKNKHRAASRALELANQKFKNGNYSLTDLSNDEKAFYQAELEQLQTIIDYNKIVYELKKYAGMEL